MFLQSAAERPKVFPERLCALLKEKALQDEPWPLLVFGEEFPTQFTGAVPVRVKELLGRWPATVPERIERAFCCLVLSTDPELRAGRSVEFARSRADEYLPFTLDVSEAQYFVGAMQSYGWIALSGNLQAYKVEITPEGWATFHELTQRAKSPQNPAFVAMWFGGDKDKDRMKMTRLYEDAIKPAINAAGYRAKRAGTDEHNEPIMDRVVEDIRRAPFVVAELSDDNNGVYYEAGLAKGRGIEVIYCCRDEHKPHFDVTGINLVKWTDEANLRTRLEDRIVGSQTRGPYDFSDVPAT